MNSSINQQLDAWVNDHLDLYNYAVQIGDTDWQQQIADSLANKDAYAKSLYDQAVQRQLWSEFDLINRRMLELFDAMRTQAPDETQLEKFRQTMQELKRRRLAIVKQIKSVH
jgi:predicted  nucleic acid-binding Zn-ribbon protein